MFTNKDVMALRAKTGVGMMDCKKALTEAEGNMEKAIELLREKGMATASKRADKIASQGIVYAMTKGDCGVLVEVNCESDFVARGDQFKELCANVASYIIDNNIADIDTLNGEQTINDLVHEAIAKIGEKINVRRFAKFNGNVTSYIHMGGKIGVMLEGTCSSDIAHDVALQIAAANPLYLNKEDVPTAALEKEKEILRAQALNEGKPAAIVDKMVIGRINKYYKDVCLMEQPFVKDGEKAVKNILDGTISAFVRYEMGEGLEKKNEDLASEVQAQIDASKK